MRFDGKPVFVAQVGRPVGGRFAPDGGEDIVLHEDVDEARNLLVQDMMYSGGLEKLGFVTVSARPRRRTRCERAPYRRLRAVLFFATRPLSLSDVEILDWVAVPSSASRRGLRRARRMRDEPLMPYSADTPPLVLAPASQAGVQDKRGALPRDLLRRAGGARGELPDYRPCDDALTRVGAEPAGTGKPVDLGPVEAAPDRGGGAGHRLRMLRAVAAAARHRRASTCTNSAMTRWSLKVDALSSSATNARQIRDAIMAMPEEGAPRLVLIGYSKGAPDILEAVVAYPEIRSRVAAVVSAAGAVGGSALANDAEQYQADLLRHFPGANCGSGDGGAVESLRPAMRQAWLAQNPLPRDVRYYSLVTFPQPERISSILDLELRQARPHRRAQRQPGDLLRPGRPRQHASSGTSMRTTGRSRCRSTARTPPSPRCSSPRTPIRARRCSKRCCASSRKTWPGDDGEQRARLGLRRDHRAQPATCFFSLGRTLRPRPRA